jgi:hypothetical protein
MRFSEDIFALFSAPLDFWPSAAYDVDRQANALVRLILAVGAYFSWRGGSATPLVQAISLVAAMETLGAFDSILATISGSKQAYYNTSANAALGQHDSELTERLKRDKNEAKLYVEPSEGEIARMRLNRGEAHGRIPIVPTLETKQFATRPPRELPEQEEPLLSHTSKMVGNQQYITRARPGAGTN